MKEIGIKKHIIYLFGTAILIFILNKFYLRPWVLKNELPEYFRIFTYSIPNLIEAIIGTLIVTGILMQLRQQFNKRFGNIKDIYVHFLAVGIAGVYVLTQEFKFHNLGGNNVFDIHDVLASLIGLAIAFCVIQSLGFINNITDH